MSTANLKLKVFAGALALVGSLAGAETKVVTTETKVASVSPETVTTLGLTVQKSEFTDSYTSGKDPFFPESTRRAPKTAEVVAVPTRVVAQDPRRIDQLSLKGITGADDRRFALINNRTFAEGETGNVRIADGVTIKIRVLEIAEKSVMLAVEGESGRHQLKIHETLYDFDKIP